MAKTGKIRLSQAVQGFGDRKQDQKVNIPGILGFVIAGQQKVEVTGRPGFVYVQVQDNFSEVIQAYNESVSPVYGLPVFISRDTLDTTRYVVTGRDTARYSNWVTTSSYLPKHGNQHSFSPESGGGGDIVWIDERQFLPLLLTPSGSAGAGSVVIQPDTIWQQNMWRRVGGTGTSNLLSSKPSGSNALLVLVYIDANGNPQTTLGNYFDNSLTGTIKLFLIFHLPSVTDIPIGAVRLVSGTSTLLWDNIYDLRAMFRDSVTATGSSGGSAHTIQKDGSNQTQRNYLNFVGDGFEVYDNGVATVISGTSGGTGGGSNTLLIYDDSVSVNTASRLSFEGGLECSRYWIISICQCYRRGRWKWWSMDTDR